MEARRGACRCLPAQTRMLLFVQNASHSNHMICTTCTCRCGRDAALCRIGYRTYTSSCRCLAASKPTSTQDKQKKMKRCALFPRGSRLSGKVLHRDMNARVDSLQRYVVFAFFPMTSISACSHLHDGSKKFCIHKLKSGLIGRLCLKRLLRTFHLAGIHVCYRRRCNMYVFCSGAILISK
jgi:hypothetical protein